MLDVRIETGALVDLHVKEEIIQRCANMKPISLSPSPGQVHGEGIYETLGWGSLSDFAGFSKVERIWFDTDYDLTPRDDAPSLYLDENFDTFPNNEAAIVSFMKRTRTVENFVSLLSTLPRVRELTLTLCVEVRPHMDWQLDDEDEEAES